ncbi:LPP20 family lipoprotein [Flocculibacter collagenilyticus]|uniref:LPP20 family lipoprotein n=1 Tax=Flocculibacter collagenilyticus TaxID=2744479 RepID=UPI0018F3D9A1
MFPTKERLCRWNGATAKVLTAVVLTVGLSGCAQFFDKHIEWEYEEPKNFPIIRAVGFAPISLQKGESQQLKVLMAIRASKLDAYRELAEQVYGQQISSSSSMQNLVSRNDNLKTKVNGLIKGAKVIKTYAVGDTYATELELDMKQVYELYRVSNKTRRVKKVSFY